MTDPQIISALAYPMLCGKPVRWIEYQGAVSDDGKRFTVSTGCTTDILLEVIYVTEEKADG